MNPTIHDVIAHPAIKRLVFTINQTEIERMRDILQVLSLYDRIQSAYRTYKLTELTTNGQQDYFMHFIECPWSSGHEGPDMCICCHVKRDCSKIIDILNKLSLDGKSDRLKTFHEQWKLSSPTAEDLATAGFYYLGIGDRVRCAYCGIEIGQWEKEDKPLKLHKKWSPSCPHLKSKRIRNVSI